MSDLRAPVTPVAIEKSPNYSYLQPRLTTHGQRSPAGTLGIKRPQKYSIAQKQAQRVISIISTLLSEYIFGSCILEIPLEKKKKS